jgi:hypothetical protein
MLTRSLTPFGRREKRRERAEPFLRAALEVTRRDRVRHFLQPRRVAAGEERIATLAKGDAFPT